MATFTISTAAATLSDPMISAPICMRSRSGRQLVGPQAHHRAAIAQPQRPGAARHAGRRDPADLRGHVRADRKARWESGSTARSSSCALADCSRETSVSSNSASAGITRR